MGYSNKRRRSNRKRARTLNAMQNNRNHNHNASTSEGSSLDPLETASSSSTSFCTTHSHHCSTMSFEDNMIPSSIFLDDINVTNPSGSWHNNAQVEDNEDEQFSGDTLMVDELLNLDKLAPSDESSTDEVEVWTHSTTSTVVDNIGNNIPHFSPHQHHPRFDEMTCDEIASFKIMSLLDTAGAPRICYDRLVALLKKLSKQGFDIRKAINRETLMQRLGRKCNARPRYKPVSSINKKYLDSSSRTPFKTYCIVPASTYTTLYQIIIMKTLRQGQNTSYGTPHGWTIPFQMNNTGTLIPRMT